ncbi:MAG: hypothetical protein HZA53_05605 [Planctomycetes bacterium]|nr:hypothetical protein [Planctomycetota bacterium]
MLAGAVIVAVAVASFVVLERCGAASVSRAGELAFAPVEDPNGARPIEAAAPAVEAREWSQLRADATRLLGRRVKFVVQFHGEVGTWKCYLSRFSARDFSAFQFWTDEQFPFRSEDFTAPIARVFARRGSGAEDVLHEAKRYSRFEIEGTLRELFLGEPWIEAESVRVLPEALTDGSVIHGGRALSLMDDGLWKLAESELDIALQARVPERARAELERLRQACRANSAPEARAPSRPWTGPTPNLRSPRRREPLD